MHLFGNDHKRGELDMIIFHFDLNENEVPIEGFTREDKYDNESLTAGYWTSN